MAISCFDMFTACKAPHMVGVLGTLGVFFGTLIFLVYVSSPTLSCPPSPASLSRFVPSAPQATPPLLHHA